MGTMGWIFLAVRGLGALFVITVYYVCRSYDWWETRWIAEAIEEAEKQSEQRNDHRVDVWEVVIRDMEKRHRMGVESYGVPLTPNNDKNMLWEAYLEQLDHCVYLRCCLLEQEASEQK